MTLSALERAGDQGGQLGRLVRRPFRRGCALAARGFSFDEHGGGDRIVHRGDLRGRRLGRHLGVDRDDVVGRGLHHGLALGHPFARGRFFASRVCRPPRATSRSSSARRRDLIGGARLAGARRERAAIARDFALAGLVGGAGGGGLRLGAVLRGGRSPSATPPPARRRPPRHEHAARRLRSDFMSASVGVDGLSPA